MANLPGLKGLCTPAQVYLTISIITLVVIALQNLGNPSSYCVGRYTCNVSSISMLYSLKLLYVIFWTWILNIICKEGYTSVSWFLVILPFMLMFIFIALLFLNYSSV